MMDLFTATMMAEGAEGFEAECEEDLIEAWQLLIDTGTCWTLQGSFGRTAMNLINEGVCTMPPAPDKAERDRAFRNERYAIRLAQGC